VQNAGSYPGRPLLVPAFLTVGMAR